MNGLETLAQVSVGEQVGRGITNPYFGSVECIVKHDRVAQEFFAATIGEFLGVPVAPGVVAKVPHISVYTDLAWCSIRMGSGPLLGVPKPLAIHKWGEAAALISAFDVLIGNADRHDFNIGAVDNKLFAFDHGYTMATRDLQNVIRPQYVDARNRKTFEKAIKAFKKMPVAYVKSVFAKARAIDPSGFDSEKEALFLDRMKNLDQWVSFGRQDADHIVCKPSYTWDEMLPMDEIENVVCECKPCVEQREAEERRRSRFERVQRGEPISGPVMRDCHCGCGMQVERTNQP